MKHAPIIQTAAFLALAACGGSVSVGGLTAPALPIEVESPCEHPARFLSAGDWEIMAGRIGDALLECGAEKGVAVDAYNNLRGTVGSS